MEERLTYQLSPLISAYRPHDPIPTKQELGEQMIDKSPLSMIELCEQVGVTYERTPNI